MKANIDLKNSKKKDIKKLTLYLKRNGYGQNGFDLENPSYLTVFSTMKEYIYNNEKHSTVLTLPEDWKALEEWTGIKANKPTVKDRLEKLEKKVKLQDKQIRGMMLFNMAEVTAKSVSDFYSKPKFPKGGAVPENKGEVLIDLKGINDRMRDNFYEHKILEKELEIKLKKAEIDLLQAEIKELKT